MYNLRNRKNEKDNKKYERGYDNLEEIEKRKKEKRRKKKENERMEKEYDEMMEALKKEELRKKKEKEQMEKQYDEVIEALKREEGRKRKVKEQMDKQYDEIVEGFKREEEEKKRIKQLQIEEENKINEINKRRQKEAQQQLQEDIIRKEEQKRQNRLISLEKKKEKEKILKQKAINRDQFLAEIQKQNNLIKMKEEEELRMEKEIEKKEKEEEEERQRKLREENWPSQNTEEFKDRFIEWAVKEYSKGKNFFNYICDKKSPKDFPHQEILECITPKKFDKGVLLHYMTGSGKTKSMIKILNECFADPRPKIFFGSKDNQIDNFLIELLVDGWVRQQKKSKDTNKYYMFLYHYFNKKNNKNDLQNNFFIKNNTTKQEIEELKAKDLNTIKDTLEFNRKDLKIYKGQKKGDVMESIESMEYEPVAPLRMYNYTKYISSEGKVQGEAFAKFVGNMEKQNFEGEFRQGKHLFSDLIIMWDEMHYLWWDYSADTTEEKEDTSNTEERNAIQKKNIILQQACRTRQNTLLIGATATPFINKDTEKDYKTFMEIIMGVDDLSKYPNPMNYIFHFNDINSPIFPRNATAITDIGAKKITYYLNNHKIMENIKTEYNIFRNNKGSSSEQKFNDKLLQYSNISNLPFTISTSRRIVKLDNINQLDCKLNKIVDDVMEYMTNNEIITIKKKKVLILCHLNEGFYLLEAMFEKKLKKKKCINFKSVYGLSKNLTSNYDKSKSKQTKFLDKRRKSSACANYNFEDCDKELVDTFNSVGNEEVPKNKVENLEDKDCNVLLANADEYSQGIDFIGVTKLIMVNPPKTYGNFLQKLGRVTRACRFDKIYNFEVEVYVAKSISNMFPTIDEINYNKLKEEKKEERTRNKKMYDISFQKMILTIEQKPSSWGSNRNIQSTTTNKQTSKKEENDNSWKSYFWKKLGY